MKMMKMRKMAMGGWRRIPYTAFVVPFWSVVTRGRIVAALQANCCPRNCQWRLLSASASPRLDAHFQIYNFPPRFLLLYCSEVGSLYEKAIDVFRLGGILMMLLLLYLK